jgi:putative iron-dependent peroxidase
MLENMFIGRPPGNYDRLLDFSRAVTGSLFFVPSATFLESVTEDEPAVAETAPAPAEPTPSISSPSITSPSVTSVREGSLGIGSLKGDIRHE